MKIEIITIGDEILTGHTIDSNSAFIAEQLTSIGFNVTYISSTGDSLEQMEESFRLALKRANIVITTGGLGPTDDDNTKKALVKVFKRNLIFHEEILEDIKSRYQVRGIDMPAINQNQALLPQGAKVFPNKSGSAVGIGIIENNRTFISLPGVPFEMKQIMLDEVIPYVKGLITNQSLYIIKLRTTGIVESKLAELIKPNLQLEENVRLAYLPTFSGVDLRILAAGKTFSEAQEKARTQERYLESIAGKYIYGKDDDTLPDILGQLLKDNDKTMAVAESCTGGQLGETITSISGASEFFLGGLITYSNASKIQLLGVPAEIIEKYGAVSEECALAMATGCRNKFECDYALAITGIAGPTGGSDDKPVGTTFIGLSSKYDEYVHKFVLGNNREANRIRASYAALELLRRDILDIK